MHSVLYKTCFEVPLPKYIYLIIKGSIFDGFSITMIHFISDLFFSGTYKIIMFLLFSVIFAYIWEMYSIKVKKWEYSDKMPIILGVGVTPLVQLTLTGILTIYLTYYLN